MLKMNDGPIEVKILSAGSNWLKVGSMIGLGLTGYYSPLPKGSTVSVHTAHTGEACLSGPSEVDAGRYHFGMTTPTWLAATAASAPTSDTGRKNPGSPRRDGLPSVNCTLALLPYGYRDTPDATSGYGMYVRALSSEQCDGYDSMRHCGSATSICGPSFHRRCSPYVGVQGTAGIAGLPNAAPP